MTVLEILLALPALALLALAAFLALEVFGALLPMRRAPRVSAGPVAVVVPAHDEAAGIAATLRDLRTQLRSGDRLLVVADNCTDETAAIARAEGAEVLERQDETRRGKGYALQHALDHLKENPPSIVAFVDADCRPAADCVIAIAEAAAASGRPVQALYVMRASEAAPAQRKVAEFAWLFLNRVRMGGLYTLFDACRLTGSGMALPWDAAKDLNLASAETVEDFALGLTLAENGQAPIFVPDAVVTSDYPHAEESAIVQRARWERGTLRLALRRAPALLVEGVRKRDIRLFAVGLDAALPPLTVFAILLGAVLVLSLPLLAADRDAPFDLTLWAIGFFVAAVLAGWIAFGRRALPLRTAGALADYLHEKLKVYGAKAQDAASRWTRTGRDAPPDRP